jgi:6-phospho-beta-glucosidase
MSDAVPVAVLGGGAYAARLVEVIASVADMPALELRLHARDRGRLDAIASHAAARTRALGAPHRVGAFPALDAALDGAAAVVLLVRVGGLAARAHDEAFPVRFGQVGDEGVGLGGLASAWRTVPVLDSIAARIAARAAGAHVLDLIAPLGVTTRLLHERGLRTVGLCELPVVTLDRWRAWAGEAAAAAPPLAYAGLNHLGFFWSPGCPPLDHPVLRAAVERGEVPGELMHRLGAAPLHYFVDVFEPEAARGLGRHRAPGRALELARLQDDLLRRFRDKPGAPVVELDRRPTPWFEQALVPALRAALGGPGYRGAINVAGGGLLEEAAPEVVVELFGCLDAAGAHIDPVPPRPPAVRALVARLAAAEDLLYRAAAGRDRELLAGALCALPLPWTDAARNAARADLLDCICLPPSSIPDFGSRQ